MNDGAIGAQAVLDGGLVANPDVLLLQGRLVTPGYEGVGKWVLFNPHTRKTFGAIGKYRVPDVVALLAHASGHSIGQESLQQPSQFLSDRRQLERLTASGLLSPRASTVEPPGETFLHQYHLASFDYPFLDYSDPGWRNQDRAQMHQYARMWPNPPTVTPRNGQSFPLPSVSTSFPYLPSGDEDRSGGLEHLAFLLRWVFGPIGAIEAEFGPWLRKTSPSGGARHPTEGVVLLPRNLDTVPSGAYVYDVGGHSLVDVGDEYPRESWAFLSDDVVGFVVRTRVERAMWRYRDIRAFRPLLLDSGHIVETLALLLALSRNAVAVAPPICSDRDFSWTVEPEVALIVAGAADALARLSWPDSRATWATQRPNSLRRRRHLTSPGMYMKFEEGGIQSYALWPQKRSLNLDLVDFEILTHCLPSRRGDRDTTFRGIVETVDGATPARITRLCDGNALLDAPVGRGFYSGLDLWVRHGWYLTFLAYLEARASWSGDTTAFVPEFPTPLPGVSPDELLPVLLKRRTTRSFTPEAVEWKALETVLDATAVCPSYGYRGTFRVFVAILSVPGVEPGLYEWSRRDRRLNSLGRVLSAEEIQAATIGQQWAGAGAVNLWLVQEIDLSDPGRYELDLTELGRIGQRICVSVTAQDLGVFLTPAVADRRLCEALGIARPLESVMYSFTIGHPRRPLH